MLDRIRHVVRNLNRAIRPEPAGLRILKNVFGSDHPKRALLSYIRDVFTNDGVRYDPRHTNRRTTFLIGEVLHELGYTVDVASWDDGGDGDFSTYHLVIGLGKPVDHALLKRTSRGHPHVIWFGTGCNPLYSNAATLKRVTDFYARTGKILLESSRYIREDWPLQHELSDHVLLHGASFARATYAHPSVSCLHAPVFMEAGVDTTAKDLTRAKKSFLWFGSGSLLHKGLDLALEVFSSRDDCQLHVCGDVRSELRFHEHYRPLLDHHANITKHGFVDVRSDRFLDLLRSCSFVIFPSASEGNSPSVITCMANGGLIPVVSDGADIDPAPWLIRIATLNVPGVAAAVDEALLLSEDEIRRRSEEILRHTRHFNSFAFFKSDFARKLSTAVEGLA